MSILNYPFSGFSKKRDIKDRDNIHYKESSGKSLVGHLVSLLCPLSRRISHLEVVYHMPQLESIRIVELLSLQGGQVMEEQFQRL